MAGHTAVTTRANLSARRVIAAAALNATKCSKVRFQLLTFKAFRGAKALSISSGRSKGKLLTTSVSETRVVHYYADCAR